MQLFLQWDHLDGVPHPLDREDAAASLRLTTLWTNFVKYGHPTPPGSELGITWQPFTQTDQRSVEEGDHHIMD